MRILLGPLWLRFVYWSVVGAVVVVLSTSLSSSSSSQPLVTRWPLGTLFAVVLAIAFGALLTFSNQKNRAPYLAAVEGLAPAQRSAAVSLIYGGPAPLDPVVHAAALRLGKAYLTQSALYRRRQLLVSGILFAGAVLLVATGYDDGLQKVAVPLAFAILIPVAAGWSQFQLRRIETQHALLTEAQHARG
jgi:hypothetical protein